MLYLVVLYYRAKQYCNEKMEETRDNQLVKKLLPKNELIENTRKSYNTDCSVKDEQNLDGVRTYDGSSVFRCKNPFNKHDRHLIFMVVGLVLLALGFMFLKISKRLIEPTK